MNHRRYNPNKSKTSSEIDFLKVTNKDTSVEINQSSKKQEIVIYFGTGSVRCELLRDVICVNQLCSENSVILGAIFETDNPFGHVKFDGIIGLSFKHLSISEGANFVDLLISQKKIDYNVFSFYFNKDDHVKSQIVFGGVDRNRINQRLDEIPYFEVISNDYWEIKIDNIYYGDTKFQVCQKFKCSGIIDTGTSMIAGPRGYND